MGARIAQLQSSVGGKGGTPIEIEEEECQETNPRVVVVKSTMLRNICYKLEPVHCPKIQHKILQEQVKMQRSIFRPNLDQQLKQQVQGTGAFIQGHELIPKCYSNVLQVLMMNEYTQENVGLPDIDNVNVCAASNPAVVVDKLKEQAHQGPCSRTAQLKQQMRKFYQRKELEAMQKRKANTEHKDKDTSGHAAVEIQQGKQPADNTQQMQQVPEFVDQEAKNKTNYTACKSFPRLYGKLKFFSRILCKMYNNQSKQEQNTIGQIEKHNEDCATVPLQQTDHVGHAQSELGKIQTIDGIPDVEGTESMGIDENIEFDLQGNEIQRKGLIEQEGECSTSATVQQYDEDNISHLTQSPAVNRSSQQHDKKNQTKRKAIHLKRVITNPRIG
uniref:Uncharacterized protein n=1 Tax=Solanum lycopersicum TaxID=4081 RepID=A0A3Q7GHM7_SOLLC